MISVWGPSVLILISRTESVKIMTCYHINRITALNITQWRYSQRRVLRLFNYIPCNYNKCQRFRGAPLRLHSLVSTHASGLVHSSDDLTLMFVRCRLVSSCWPAALGQEPRRVTDSEDRTSRTSPPSLNRPGQSLTSTGKLRLIELFSNSRPLTLTTLLMHYYLIVKDWS